MTSSAFGSDPARTVGPEELLADFLARQLAGDAVDFDAFCADHPEHAGDLRDLRAELLDSQSLADGLFRIYGAQGPGSSKGAGPSGPRHRGARDFLDRLVHEHTADRYELADEIARGGMGAILRARDKDLRRELAMKVVREDKAAARAKDPEQERAYLQRFLEEAQVTAQLSHPGVVPVHELGLDREGRAYFTMSLVHGDTLRDVYGKVWRGEDGWTLTRAVNVLLKVCETMAYAHSRQVVHRDLKPANVMVGRFGEVYVMDWGLAKLAGRKRRRRTAAGSDGSDGSAASAPAVLPVSIDRDDAPDGDPSSASLTLEGTLVGSPGYMSPEQAYGRELDERSDVYAIGAMLYALLAGRAPYFPEEGPVSPVDVVIATREGPPESLSSIVGTDIPGELVAICEKAMTREPLDRYADTSELAEDVRAFLEGRVVRAYETGAFAELRKWMKRNRGMAASLAGAVLAVVIGTSATAFVQTKAAERFHRDSQRILGLADVKRLSELEKAEPGLWPAVPDKVPELREWIATAGDLQDRFADHEEFLASLEAWSLPAEEKAWLATTVSGLIERLEEMPELRHGVEERLALAQTLEEKTLKGPEAAARWASAIEEIGQLERYAGMPPLVPQLGLLPLGEDPESGLYEFWHVATGERPPRDAETGRHVLQKDSGIVLVLLPGGEATIGASHDKKHPYYDPFRSESDGLEDPIEVVLEPFFCTKYELMQAQWGRLMDVNPSQVKGPLHPVDSVTLEEAALVAERAALGLPSEAQWEYACRAGSHESFSFGTAWAEAFLRGQDGWQEAVDWSIPVAHMNAYDLLGREFSPQDGRDDGTVQLKDGFAATAPVGSFLGNSFGLYDMHGNVWEWCVLRGSSGSISRSSGNEKRAAWPNWGCLRGGSWFSSWDEARSANRFDYEAGARSPDVGVRLVRPVER